METEPRANSDHAKHSTKPLPSRKSPGGYLAAVVRFGRSPLLVYRLLAANATGDRTPRDGG